MFPWEAMPEPARWLSEGLPLTHFLRIVRGVVLRGSGLADLAGEAAALVVIIGVLILIASLRFRKRLA
jgi:ABC-2 type transport system permease protein